MGVNWGDTFYPGNPKRRQEVIQLSTRVFTVMDNNFSALNDLIKYLNDHVKLSTPLQCIYIDHKATLKSNSDRLIRTIEQVQKIVADIDAKLAQRLEPDLYRKLKSPDISFIDKLQLANTIIDATLSVIATAVGIALIVAISGGFLLGGVVGVIGVVGAGVVGSIVVGTLFLGADMIAGAIIGAVERDKLNDTIKEFEHVLETFEPASKKFQKQILHVLVVLEDH